MSVAIRKPFDADAFSMGDAARADEYFGVHRQGEELIFRVWAPHADAVSICGDFTDWNTDRLVMQPLRDGGADVGIRELRLNAECVQAGDRYKYFIRNGRRHLYKADPYGVLCEEGYESASVIYDIEGYPWRDAGWLRYRKECFACNVATRNPINVYELDVGSWKRHDDGSFYTYRELAASLVTYVKQMGYTHIALMPICEHSIDASGHCQVMGHYAAAARYGEPKELMAFVDMMHEAGIGVIFSWDPSCFSTRAPGLVAFDGQPLYEYSQPEHSSDVCPETRRFHFGRGEVQSFLLSNLFFWIEKFHADGILVHSIVSMLDPSCDTAERFGNTPDRDAVAFLKKLNQRVSREHPDVMMIAAEEADALRDADKDGNGLGFGMRWDTQWRKTVIGCLTEKMPIRLSPVAATRTADGAGCFLSISHGERSLMGREGDDKEQKLAFMRTFLSYMMTYPGKKLSFMGCEIGDAYEWNSESEVAWHLLDDAMHAKLQLFVAELNHLYLQCPALWEGGLEPIGGGDTAGGLQAYRRRDAEGCELTVLLNFTPIEYNGYCLPVDKAGAYRELLNSDGERYGGRGRVNDRECHTESQDGRQVLRIRVAPMSAILFSGACDSERRADATSLI